MTIPFFEYPAPEIMTLPAFPLAIGTVLQDTDTGSEHPIAGINIVITCDDGTTATIALTTLNDAWWGPGGGVPTVTTTKPF